ncbi:MAG: hypothetical protein AAF849_07045 [Bacteroidota bacterium]
MKKQILFLIASLLFSVTAFAGGPWPKKKGTGFYKLAQIWIIADQHFTDMGGLDPNTTFATYSTNFYGEYGITDRLTGVVYAPFFVRSLFYNTISETTGDLLKAGEALNDFGDLDIGLQYGLVTDKAVVASVGLTLGFPTGNPGGGSEGNLQTGDGEFNQLLRLDVGTSRRLGDVDTWYSAYAGFNNRTNDFSDEIRYGVEAGGQFLDRKLLGLVRVFGISSLKNGTPSAFSNSTSLFANNAEFLAISPEIGYNISENVGISANVAFAVWGRIILAAPTYSVGVYMNL